MKVELKEGLFIEGFDDRHTCAVSAYNNHCLIYEGKTSDLSEEIVNECVDSDIYLGFRKYNVPAHIKVKDWTANCGFNSVKESIQSACPKEYCIIYKIE